MENSYKRKPKNDNKLKKPVKTEILENIFDEYSLKRNKFDPNKPSPDMFNKKLQHRMNAYYKTLYNSSSSNNKY